MEASERLVEEEGGDSDDECNEDTRLRTNTAPPRQSVVAPSLRRIHKHRVLLHRGGYASGKIGPVAALLANAREKRASTWA